jgi:hypothetical protein
MERIREIISNIPEPLKESIKEFFRVILLSIVPLLISYLEQGTGIDWRAIIIVAVLAGLRFVDKLLHLNAPEGTAGGLTRF